VKGASKQSQCRSIALLLVSLAACCFLLPASSGAGDPLDAILGRVGKRVEAYLEQISAMNCTEHVLQERLGGNGKTLEKEERSFDYLILITDAGGDLNLAESRLAPDEDKHTHKARRPLLISNGFATLFLVFHPYYAPGFQFHDDGEEIVAGRTLSKIRFQHIPGTRSPAALAVRGREYPLDLSGVAWIDPDTGIIEKITAGLESGMEDIGLRRLRSEIEYKPVSFAGSPQQYWLPSLATVEVESLHQHWRNTHQFYGYKRFSVDTKEQIAKQ
jgi:hypothetical protein